MPEATSPQSGAKAPLSALIVAIKDGVTPVPELWIMQEEPKSLADFKGRPPRVEVTRDSKDEADIAATKGLLELYTQPDGFHCPRCEAVITDVEEAVYHLAEEINKALDHLGR